MIKKLLTGLALCSAVIGFAQNGKSIKGEIATAQVTEVTLSLNSAKTTTSSLNCDTVYNFNVYAPTTTITLYTASTGTSCPTGGYVTGNNCYGFSEMASYTKGTSYSSIPSPSVTGCFVFFYKNATTGAGTKGVGTNTIGLRIYNGTMASGPTATPAPTAIGSTSAPMSAINAVFSPTSNIGVYQFSFASPVSVTPGAGFFTSVVLPKVTGDTAVIWMQKNATTTSAWEGIGTSYWGDMNADWGINFELAVFPILGCSSPSGIKENELNTYFNLVPNPASGVVSLVSTLSGAEFEYTVLNAVGQKLMTKKISGASVNEINLTDYNAGVYFINITSGNSTITKKLIVNK